MEKISTKLWARGTMCYLTPPFLLTEYLFFLFHSSWTWWRRWEWTMQEMTRSKLSLFPENWSVMYCMVHKAHFVKTPYTVESHELLIVSFPGLGTRLELLLLSFNISLISHSPNLVWNINSFSSTVRNSSGQKFWARCPDPGDCQPFHFPPFFPS